DGGYSPGSWGDGRRPGTPASFEKKIRPTFRTKNAPHLEETTISPRVMDKDAVDEMLLKNMGWGTLHESEIMQKITDRGTSINYTERLTRAGASSSSNLRRRRRREEKKS
ncbi:unnamed protein product, partial [Amoebophrya sp. A120]